MHRLLKSLYIRRVSADYRFAIFRDVTYKLCLHHYLNHKLSQLTRCYVTYIKMNTFFLSSFSILSFIYICDITASEL
jgi:hypothetical protein